MSNCHIPFNDNKNKVASKLLCLPDWLKLITRFLLGLWTWQRVPIIPQKSSKDQNKRKRFMLYARLEICLESTSICSKSLVQRNCVPFRVLPVGDTRGNFPVLLVLCSDISWRWVHLRDRRSSRCLGNLRHYKISETKFLKTSKRRSKMEPPNAASREKRVKCSNWSMFRKG